MAAQCPPDVKGTWRLVGKTLLISTVETFFDESCLRAPPGTPLKTFTQAGLLRITRLECPENSTAEGCEVSVEGDASALVLSRN